MIKATGRACADAGRKGEKEMPPIHLLIKPSSGACNLRCRYCFYHDEMKNREQASFGMMTEETLTNVIRKALDYAEGQCTIAYQGGEPTLIGLDFFKKSIELQKQYNHKKLVIHNAIQTNGYALDEEWAKFFAENHFLVGLSMDGTRETHDRYRLSVAGEGTFREVQRTARMFDRFGVEYNILTVVNGQTARKIQSIYTFYKKNGFRYLQFIPCLDPLGEEPGSREYSLTPKAYGEFLCRLFDLWYRDLMQGEEVSIRQFDNYVQMILGYPPESCGMSGICSYQNVVEADGGVYPCDFYVLDGYCLGNLNVCGFEEIQEKRREIGFVEESREIHPDCRECRWFPLCRGGCKRYREPRNEDGQLRKNCFCESYEVFFAYAGERMQRIAASLLRHRRP